MLDLTTPGGWLYQHWNDLTKGRGHMVEFKIYASPKLFDDYSNTLQCLTRILPEGMEPPPLPPSGYHDLRFKTALFIRDENLKCDGWAAYFEEIER